MSNFRVSLTGFFVAFLCSLLLGADTTGAHCDRDIALARRIRVQPVAVNRRENVPIANHAGMRFIPAGEFWMGTQDKEFEDALPVHQVQVSAFWMDETDVTNSDFARFVKATGYRTLAERTPDSKDLPGVDLALLQPGGVVFTAPGKPVLLSDPTQWWAYVAHADWRHPDGPTSNIAGHENDPVVQIAWEDAAAYAHWAHKRLPTEAEWEYAARGGLDRLPYTWGQQLKPNGRWQANIFQGHFPERNTASDGYAMRAPVKSFPPNGYGLYDMAGNVWQWCADWYRADYYRTLAANRDTARDPQGPSESLDPDEPATPKRVQRGGSFLCTDQYCERYKVGTRGKGDVNTSNQSYRLPVCSLRSSIGSP